jgi:Putative MetA-pathway of phenol degradation
MRRASTYVSASLAALCLALGATRGSAQDLDPRAYIWVPVNATILIAGFSVSHGAVVTDPASPIQDLRASVQTPSLGLARTFPVFGRTAQALVALPYSWAQASGTVTGESRSVDRAGLSDMRVRVSVLLRGGPAATAGEIARASRRAIIGMSVNVVVPTGQYFSDKVINLGTSRWAFKPELAVSYPAGRRWLMDVYAGVWLFTKNDTYYPGTSVRTQKPLSAVQAHLSYNIRPLAWAALDATFYTGGQSTVNGVQNNDRVSNSRVGATIVFPVGQRNAFKIAASTGAVVRSGANFDVLSIGWQRAWLSRPPASMSK